MLVDTLGHRRRALVHAADVSESEGGVQLLEGAGAMCTQLRTLWVDQGGQGEGRRLGQGAPRLDGSGDRQTTGGDWLRGHSQTQDRRPDADLAHEKPPLEERRPVLAGVQYCLSVVGTDPPVDDARS